MHLDRRAHEHSTQAKNTTQTMKRTQQHDKRTQQSANTRVMQYNVFCLEKWIKLSNEKPLSFAFLSVLAEQGGQP